MPRSDPARDPPRTYDADSPPPGDAPFQGTLPEGLAILLHFSQRVASALCHPARAGQLYATIAEEVARIASPASAAVCLLEEGDLQVRAATGLLADWEGEWLPLEGSFEGAAVLSHAPQTTSDLASDSRVYLGRERDVTVGPALALPLSAEGRSVGALLLARSSGASPFTPGEVERLRMAEAIIAAAVENSRAFERARRSRSRLRAWRSEKAGAGTPAKQILRAVRHEVNNPLAVILGEMQLLSRSDHLPEGEALQGIIEAVLQEAYRLQSFTRRLAALEDMPGEPVVNDRGILELPA